MQAPASGKAIRAGPGDMGRSFYRLRHDELRRKQILRFFNEFITELNQLPYLTTRGWLACLATLFVLTFVITFLACI